MDSISADILKKCFIAGAKNLEANKDYINELKGCERGGGAHHGCRMQGHIRRLPERSER